MMTDILIMKDQMIQSLKSRFAGIEDNQLLSVATLTDPRFKDCYFDNNIAKASIKDMLQEEIRKQESTASAETLLATEDRTKAPLPKRHKNNSLLEVFSNIIGTSSAETPSLNSELDC